MNNMEYMNIEIYSKMVREMFFSVKKLVNFEMFFDIVFRIEGRIVMVYKVFLVV